MRQRGPYEAPAVARCPPRLLGPAGGPARPAPARPRGRHAGGVVGAPARAAPRGAAPARARVVDLARGRTDERVLSEALVGHREVAVLGALEGAGGVQPREAARQRARRVDQEALDLVRG